MPHGELGSFQIFAADATVITKPNGEGDNGLDPALQILAGGTDHCGKIQRPLTGSANQADMGKFAAKKPIGAPHVIVSYRGDFQEPSGIDPGYLAYQADSHQQRQQQAHSTTGVKAEYGQQRLLPDKRIPHHPIVPLVADCIPSHANGIPGT